MVSEQNPQSWRRVSLLYLRDEPIGDLVRLAGNSGTRRLEANGVLLERDIRLAERLELFDDY